MAAIEVQAVTKRFGSTRALAGIDLVVQGGSVVALLGPNGSGKTTLVRILATLLRPDGGRATVDGCDVVRDAEALRPRIGLAGQYAAVDELLTGRENLELVARLYHLARSEGRYRAQEVLERFALLDAGDRPVKDYSGGMRRRLDLGASLIARAPVLILDEPTTGLDPRSRNELWDFIAELARGGTTVLLTTQNLEEADRLADHIVVIDHGSTVATGTADELKHRIGHDILEARVGRTDLNRAVVLLAGVGGAAPQISPDEQLITIPTQAGAKALVAAARLLEDEGISLLDLGVRRPSLDDVFFALTDPSVHHAKVPTATIAMVPPPATAGPGQRSRPAIATAPSATFATVIGDIAAITHRNVVRLARSPRMVMLSIINPIALLVMFRYLLGGAIVVRSGDYVSYLLPGIFVAAIVAGGGGTAIGLAQDLQSGIIDRFRSLPMARSAVLAGRTLADMLRNFVALGIVIALAFLVGFRVHGSTAAVIGAIALIALLSYAFCWVFATIGIAVKDPESAYSIATLTFFILLFASSAFVPISTLPGWLQPAARMQPLTVTINAVRALMNAGPVHGWAWQSLLWCTAILIASATIAVHLYRKIGS